jgi:hypothetical protein
MLCSSADAVRPGIEAALEGRASSTTALSGMLEVRFHIGSNVIIVYSFTNQGQVVISCLYIDAVRPDLEDVSVLMLCGQALTRHWKAGPLAPLHLVVCWR